MASFVRDKTGMKDSTKLPPLCAEKKMRKISVEHVGARAEGCENDTLPVVFLLTFGAAFFAERLDNAEKYYAWRGHAD